MSKEAKAPGVEGINFVSRQKWDANLDAEDSLVALEMMSKLGFQKRTEFIRYALTNPALLTQQSGYEAAARAAEEMTLLRRELFASGINTLTARRIEAKLEEIHSAMLEGVGSCHDLS